MFSIALCLCACASRIAHTENGEHANTLVLHEDLVLGLDENPPIGRVADVAVDSKGNIYVLDVGFDVIRKYTANGRFIGDLSGEGEAPGYFYAPTRMAFGPDDRLYVGGRTTIITILTPDGSPAGQIKRNFSGTLLSIAIDAKGNVYTVASDVWERKVIHKYDASTHEYVGSFCDSWAVGNDVDARLEHLHAGGAIDIGADGLLYFVQRTPQEVRIFTLDGGLVATHAARRAESLVPSDPNYLEDGARFAAAQTVSGSMVCLPNGNYLTSGKCQAL